jgi:hypothetical protein
MLGLAFQEELNFVEVNAFKCIYALVDPIITPVHKLMKVYQYKYLGQTPKWEKNRLFKIFGRVVFDFKWRSISPHISISPKIYNSVRQANLKRLLTTRFYSSRSNNDFDLDELDLTKIEDKHITEILIHNKRTAKELYAELIENKFQKTWYNIKVNLNISNEAAEKISKFIFEKYCQDKNINCLSFSVDSNDSGLQNILNRMNMKYYAYLPFYLEGKDAVLMGTTKLNEGICS